MEKNRGEEQDRLWGKNSKIQNIKNVLAETKIIDVVEIQTPLSGNFREKKKIRNPV